MSGTKLIKITWDKKCLGGESKRETGMTTSISSEAQNTLITKNEFIKRKVENQEIFSPKIYKSLLWHDRQTVGLTKFYTGLDQGIVTKK